MHRDLGARAYGERMHTTIRIRVRAAGAQYLGECLEYPVMTHGRTLEELAENMERALELFLARAQAGEEAVIAVNMDLPDD